MMISEIEVYSKDSVKLDILKEILNGEVKLSLQLDGESAEDYKTRIHRESSRVQVFGGFNISEDPAGVLLTIRPVMIGRSLTVNVEIPSSVSGKKALVVRNKTKAVEREYELNSDTAFLEFRPQGKQLYMMKTVCEERAVIMAQGGEQSRDISADAAAETSPERAEQAVGLGELEELSPQFDNRFQSFELNADTPENAPDDRFASFELEEDTVVSSTSKAGREKPAEMEIEDLNSLLTEKAEPEADTEVSCEELRRIEQEVTVVERRRSELALKKQKAMEHLEKVEAEYKKDHDALEKELEDFKARLEADESIIEYYKEHDVVPIERIFSEIRLKLEEAESQIRLFIEAKQKKTMEIESEIKSNKKQ